MGAKAKPEQDHHYYASSAFNWATAPTRKEAVSAVARMAGSDIIKRNAKSQGGLYVWSCRVEMPPSANYSISNYAPEFITVDGKVTDKPVPVSRTMESRVLSTKGHVALED